MELVEVTGGTWGTWGTRGTTLELGLLENRTVDRELPGIGGLGRYTGIQHSFFFPLHLLIS